MTLRSVPPVPYGWWMPWHCRRWDLGEIHGARCMYCDREIAVSEDAKGKQNCCLYCAMDRGFIEQVEIEPHVEPAHRIDPPRWH